MLPSDVREKVKSTIQQMIDDGADEATIKEFTEKVKAKYEAPKQAPADTSNPSMGQVMFPSASKEYAPTTAIAPNYYAGMPRELANRPVSESEQKLMAGAGDLMSLPKRAAGTAVSKAGATSATGGERTVKQSMADTETHPFRKKIDENMEDFKNGKGPGRYMDLIQGIGYDALGDPLSYAPLSLPAKVVKGANLISQAGKATAKTTKALARGVSGIAGKTADKEAVLEYAAKKGIKELESSKPMDEIFQELNDLSEAENLALRKVMHNSKSDLFEAIESGKAKIADLTNQEKAHLKAAIQAAKDEAGLAQDAVKKSVQKGRDEIDLDVETKAGNFAADKGKARGRYSEFVDNLKEDLTGEIPQTLSRDTKKKVYGKYSEITDPIEGKVSVDFTNSPYNPNTVIDKHMKYGTPEFEKFKAGLKEDIAKRLTPDIHTGKTTVSGDVLLKEKKLYQDLADGTFGEVTDAQKTLYKDLARTYREALEDAATQAGNPEYITAMREKADLTRKLVDAEDTFMPKNISKDLEVHQKVRSTVEKLDKAPELLVKLRRLQAAMNSHGVKSTVADKAEEMMKYKKGADLAKSGKLEDLEKLREIDPEMAEALIKQHNEVSTLKNAGSKLGRVKSAKDMDELESIRELKPELYEEIKSRLQLAKIKETDIGAVKRLRDMDPNFAKQLDSEMAQVAAMKKASRGLNKVADFDDADMLAGLEKVNPKLVAEIKDKLQKAQVAGKGKAGLQSMASLYRKGIGADDLKALDKLYGTKFYEQAIDARTMVDLGAGSSGKIPGFGSKERTGISQLVPNALGSAGAAIAGAPGASIGYFLGAFTSSPKKAVQMTQLANGISKISDMPVALDKIIAAAELGNTAAVLRWLKQNGLDEDEEK